MRLTNRFVRIFQWIAPVLLPAFLWFGRGFLGAPLGWMLLIGLFVVPFITLAMYVSAVVFVFDRDAAAAKAGRLVYDIPNYVLWVALLAMGMTVQDGGDDGVYGSVLSEWGVLSDGATVAAFTVALAIAAAAWIAVLIAAIVCVVHSRTGGRAAVVAR